MVVSSQARRSRTSLTVAADYEVEAVLAHKTNKKGDIHYLVKWKAYDLKNSTWEPGVNLAGCEELITLYMKNPRANVTKTAVLEEHKKNVHLLAEIVKSQVIVRNAKGASPKESSTTTTATAFDDDKISFNESKLAFADMAVESPPSEKRVLRARKSAFETSSAADSTMEKSSFMKSGINPLFEAAADTNKYQMFSSKATKDKFNWALFLKLGLSVSSLIILVYILIFHDSRNSPSMIPDFVKNLETSVANKLNLT